MPRSRRIQVNKFLLNGRCVTLRKLIDLAHKDRRTQCFVNLGIGNPLVFEPESDTGVSEPQNAQSRLKIVTLNHLRNDIVKFDRRNSCPRAKKNAFNHNGNEYSTQSDSSCLEAILFFPNWRAFQIMCSETYTCSGFNQTARSIMVLR